jgi:hypothetical protein
MINHNTASQGNVENVALASAGKESTNSSIFGLLEYRTPKNDFHLQRIKVNRWVKDGDHAGSYLHKLRKAKDYIPAPSKYS